MLKDYEKMELSTQILIGESLARGVEVRVLDEDDNFIRLKRGERTEYFRQATRTSADTYISPLYNGKQGGDEAAPTRGGHKRTGGHHGQERSGSSRKLSALLGWGYSH